MGELLSLLVNIVVILLGLVLIAILLTLWFRRSKVVEIVQNRIDIENSGGYSTEGIVEERIFNGIEESVKYAYELEGHIATEVSHSDNGDDREKEFKTIKKYFELCKKNNPPSLLSDIEDILFLNALSNGAKIPPIYQFFSDVKRALEHGHFLLVLKETVKYGGKFKIDKKIKVNGHRILLENIEAFVECVLELKDNLVSDTKRTIQLAVNQIEDQIRESIGQVNASMARDAVGSSPESSYFLIVLNAFKEALKQYDIEIADKPKFSVELIGHEKGIVLEGDRPIALRFRFTNDNDQVAKIAAVTSRPKTENQLIFAYHGSAKNIELNHGRAIVSFDFTPYLQDTEGIQEGFALPFLIEFKLKGKVFQQDAFADIPQIEQKIKIVNPFEEAHGGQPLAPASPLFIGRRELLSEMSRNLNNLKRKPFQYVVVGPSRSGKTSILNQICEDVHWLKKRYVTVKADAQASQGAKVYFRNLYERTKDAVFEICKEVKQPSERMLKTGESPSWTDLVELLRINEKRIIEEKKRIIFAVDEYQRLAAWDSCNDKDKPGMVSFQFPEMLKVISDHYSNIATFILSGTESLEDIEKYNRNWVKQLGGRLVKKELSHLQFSDVDNIVCTTFEKNQLLISKDVIECMYEYTNGQPFLVMSLSYELFQGMLKNGGFRKDKHASITDLRAAADRIDGVDMKYIWIDALDEDDFNGRIFLEAIAKLSYQYRCQQGDLTKECWVTMKQVLQLMSNEYDMVFKYDDFQRGEYCLTKHRIVEKRESPDKGMQPSYSLRYPLYAIWSSNNNRLKDAVEEYNR